MIFRFAIEPMRALDRVLTPEILDSLDPRDPRANRSRHALVLWMRSWGIRVGSRNPWRVILRSAIPLVADPRAFRSESPKRSTARHLADRKCHAEGLTLSHDLEIHLGSNGYLGLAKIEYGKVNICGLFRKTIPAETKGPRLLTSRLRSPLLPLPDLRTVLAHVSQWLPIQEVAGLRLFQHELREFGLLDDENENQKLAGYFKMPEAV